MKILILVLFSVAISFFVVITQKDTKNTVVPATSEVSVKSQQGQLHEIPGISKETIFSTDDSWTASLSASRKRVVIATGDVLLARTVNSKAIRQNNFRWPFEKTADILKSADITFINLETPLIDQCPPTHEGMRFCGDKRNIEGLHFAGVDVVNLANNHTLNYGEKGLVETATYLTQNRIPVTGTDGHVLVPIRGKLFAFLGYNDVDYPNSILQATHEKIKREVSEAARQADVVFVQFHWGNEYTEKVTERQKMWAYLAVDSGADVVIGNHPHWIQPVELYKGKIITYSHGNFVFDQMWSQKTREGLVSKYTFYDDTLVHVSFLPMIIEDYGQPYFLGGTAKEKKLAELSAMSDLVPATHAVHR
jgi:gamma-polyglutamate biosynthesis protein CapA